MSKIQALRCIDCIHCKTNGNDIYYCFVQGNRVIENTNMLTDPVLYDSGECKQGELLLELRFEDKLRKIEKRL